MLLCSFLSWWWMGETLLVCVTCVQASSRIANVKNSLVLRSNRKINLKHIQRHSFLAQEGNQLFWEFLDEELAVKCFPQYLSCVSSWFFLIFFFFTLSWKLLPDQINATWPSFEVGGAWLLSSFYSKRNREGSLCVTQAEKRLSILSCVSKKEKKVANIFLTKDREVAGCLGYAKNFSFHTYWQPEGVIIENMGKVTASFCWYSCLKRNYGNQE